MNTNTVIFEEKGQSKASSKSTILSLIDHRINELKVNYVKSWENDHSLTKEKVNKKIEALRAKKEKLNQVFDEMEENIEEVDIMFSLSIRSSVKEKAREFEFSA